MEASLMISQHQTRLLPVLLIILLLSVVAWGQEANSRDYKTIKIKNFGQMDDRFFRGAQPKERDYKDLAALGIRTIIDLREDPEAYSKPTVEALGMRYMHIPMIAKKYPTPEATELFLRTINDPDSGKFFVHCAGGRHRTGAMGAVYRFQFYHWDFERAYKEMKQYDFYTRWGHGAFKEFVEDYYTRMQKEKPVAEQR
jgi:protein tyrosine phosphatase (PTP) superfamily phosphohydrolase (DUF442 family)